jgi:hypothetical protein|tara:strand:+ start:1290 stop:1436 length:147 start_codon:yes stop_codon:yes gene_type:complete
MTASTLKLAMVAMADPGNHAKELYACVNGHGSLKEPGNDWLITKWEDD